MKGQILKISHPLHGQKIRATIYDHYKDWKEAALVASKIEGGFIRYNNKTKSHTVFYSTTINNVENQF